MFKKYFKKIISILLLLIILSQFFVSIINDNKKLIYFSNVSNAVAFSASYFVWDKKIIKDEDSIDKFKLSIETWYEYGEMSDVYSADQKIPEDTIIIIDQSAAMNNTFDSTKLNTAVANAVRTMLGKMSNTAANYSPNDRVAIIGVGGYDNDTGTYPNTEVLIGKNRYNYSELTDELYAQAMQLTDSSFYNLYENVKNLKASGTLYIDKGIEIAEKIFEKTYIEDELRNRRVILILGNSQIGNGWGNAEYLSDGNDGNSVANKALDSMYRIKNTYKAHVNAVALYSTSNAAIPLTSVNWNDGVANNTSKTDNFIHYLTDHFRYAKSLNNIGTETFTSSSNGGYVYQFMTPRNKNTLGNVLSSTFLNSGAFKTYVDYNSSILRDVISPDFKLPDNITANDIKIYLQNCDYEGLIEESLYADDENDNLFVEKRLLKENNLDVIEILGLNYYYHMYCEGYGGEKFRIEIPIELNSNAKPGIQKNTNGVESGIYFEDDGVKKYLHKFDSPLVDVPAKVNIKHICETVGDDNLELSINSVYSKLTGYLDEDYDGDDIGDGYELRAISSDSIITSNLKSNENEIISNVMYDSLYKITLPDDSNYEITKIKIKPENSPAYEVQYSNDLEIQIDDNTDITIYTKLKGRTISVSKQWDDINNEDGIRPESVNVEIYQDEVLYDTVEIKNDSNWLYEFFVEDFDKTYTFKEININENYYLKNVEEVSSNNYVLTNNKYGSILINKKDSILGNKLQGAIFKIERKNEDSTWSEVEQIETNEEGIAQLDKLIHGTYRITEEKAPDGYNLEKDRNVTEIEINSSKLDYELTILNRPQTILPETGDNGLLIIISIIFILLMIRRKYMGPLIVTQRVKNARINKNIRSNKKFKFIFNIDGKVKRKHSRKKARISYKNKRT